MAVAMTAFVLCTCISSCVWSALFLLAITLSLSLFRFKILNNQNVEKNDRVPLNEERVLNITCVCNGYCIRCIQTADF